MRPRHVMCSRARGPRTNRPRSEPRSELHVLGVVFVLGQVGEPRVLERGGRVEPDGGVDREDRDEEGGRVGAVVGVEPERADEQLLELRRAGRRALLLRRPLDAAQRGRLVARLFVPNDVSPLDT